MRQLSDSRRRFRSGWWGRSTGRPISSVNAPAMPAPLPSSLRRQLLLATLLFLLPVLGAALWLGYEEYRQATQELTEQTAATAQLSAAAIDREVLGLDRMA